MPFGVRWPWERRGRGAGREVPAGAAAPAEPGWSSLAPLVPALGPAPLTLDSLWGAGLATARRTALSAHEPAPVRALPVALAQALGASAGVRVVRAGAETFELRSPRGARAGNAEPGTGFGGTAAAAYEPTVASPTAPASAPGPRAQPARTAPTGPADHAAAPGGRPSRIVEELASKALPRRVAADPPRAAAARIVEELAPDALPGPAAAPKPPRPPGAPSRDELASEPPASDPALRAAARVRAARGWPSAAEPAPVPPTAADAAGALPSPPPFRTRSVRGAGVRASDPAGVAPPTKAAPSAMPGSPSVVPAPSPFEHPASSHPAGAPLDPPAEPPASHSASPASTTSPDTVARSPAALREEPPSASGAAAAGAVEEPVALGPRRVRRTAARPAASLAGPTAATAGVERLAAPLEDAPQADDRVAATEDAPGGTRARRAQHEGAAGMPAPPPAPEPDLDELAGRVYERVRTRLRADLLIDRERAGRLADLR